MRIFLLLAVCLAPVLCERNRHCQSLDEFHECVPVEDCDYFLQKQEKLKDLEGLEKKKQMAILKNLTCNNKPKKVCCVMPNLKSDERLDLFKARIV